MSKAINKGLKMPNHMDNQDDIRTLMEMVVRIDERVKNLTEIAEKNEQRFIEVMEAQQHLMHRVITLEQRDHNSIKEDVSNLYNRLGIVETGLIKLDVISTKQISRWDKVVDYAKDFLVAIAAAFVIWKFGLGT